MDPKDLEKAEFWLILAGFCGGVIAVVTANYITGLSFGDVVSGQLPKVRAGDGLALLLCFPGLVYASAKYSNLRRNQGNG